MIRMSHARCDFRCTCGHVAVVGMPYVLVPRMDVICGTCADAEAEKQARQTILERMAAKSFEVEEAEVC